MERKEDVLLYGGREFQSAVAEGMKRKIVYNSRVGSECWRDGKDRGSGWNYYWVDNVWRKQMRCSSIVVAVVVAAAVYGAPYALFCIMS